MRADQPSSRGGRRRSRRWALYVERLLLVVAIGALGWYVTARATAYVYQFRQGRQLEEIRDANAAPSRKGADVQLPAEGAPPPRPRRPLVGRIEVPRIGLSAIVREGVDDRTLDVAVGHVPETPLPGEPGNVAFAGHRDTFFRPLKGVRSGDRIVVTTPEGEYAYVVRETRVVAPSDVSVLEPTAEPMLTLVTCYPFHFVGNAPDRFIVRAEQVGPSAAGAKAAPTDTPRPSLMAAAAPAPGPTAPLRVAAPAPAAAAAVTKPQPAPRRTAARRPPAKPKAKEDRAKPRRGWRLIFKLR